MEEQLAGVGLVVARPLDAAELLEPRVAHPGVDRRQATDLVPDGFGVGLAPAAAHPVGQVEDDRQVVAGALGRFDRLANALDAPLRVGDGPLRLGPGRGRRQDHVGQLGGLRQEQVLDDEEVEALEQVDRPLLVGLGLDRVLADAVDRGQLAALHRVEHPRQVPAALRRDGDAPLGVELGAQRVVLDVLEAGQAVGEGAHVAAALDVVLATQRVDAAAVAADVTGQQHQVDERQDVVDRVVVLGDAERPADHRPRRRGERVGQLADGLGRDAGLALGVLERVRLDLGLVGVEVDGRALDELAVLEAGRDDLAGHRVGQGDVAADVEPEPAVGPFGGGRPARVDRVQARALADALEHVVEEDRMRLAGVAAPQDDQVRVLDLTV